MGDWEIKLGITEKELGVIKKKIRQILNTTTPIEENSEVINNFTKNDIVVILRSVALVLAEIPQWEFNTILGFERTEAEDIYVMVDQRLKKFK